MSIQAAEARGRERLVDRRVLADPRITPRHLIGVLREQGWKRRIEQIRVLRAAAMMQQSYDGLDLQLAQALQALIGPCPEKLLWVTR